MLSYTYVTDIVSQSDDLTMMRAALDTIESGVILLDVDFKARVINRAARRLWRISEEQAARRPSYAELVGDVGRTGADGTTGPELEALIALHVAHVRAGTGAPMDFRAVSGRVIRARSTALPNGGRMLTYGDVTDLARHANELEASARIDALTGLPNRRHFLELGEIEWNRYTRYQRPLSLMMIDIDRFKSINDNFGQDVGNRMLTAVARVLARVRRHSDVVARIGGEEFAILLPETPLAQAKVAATRLIRDIAQEVIIVDGRSLRVTVSIGVAEAWDAAADLAALMRRADQALCAAKSAGGNRVETAQAENAAALDLGIAR